MNSHAAGVRRSPEKYLFQVFASLNVAAFLARLHPYTVLRAINFILMASPAHFERDVIEAS